jgi:hypothetical protein
MTQRLDGWTRELGKLKTEMKKGGE